MSNNPDAGGYRPPGHEICLTAWRESAPHQATYIGYSTRHPGASFAYDVRVQGQEAAVSSVRVARDAMEDEEVQYSPLEDDWYRGNPKFTKIGESVVLDILAYSREQIDQARTKINMDELREKAQARLAELDRPSHTSGHGEDL